jgi:hypothetical protein
MESSAMNSSWVVEIERYISGDAGGVTSEAMARGSKSHHSIYRVPEYIKNMTNPNAYRPQVVSLGPFHHGDPAVLQMEKHKWRAVAHLVKRSDRLMSDYRIHELNKESRPSDRLMLLIKKSGELSSQIKIP